MGLNIELGAEKLGYRQVIGKADFSKFFISQILVSVGDGFFGVLVTFLALSMGASATTLGIVAFCLTFPRGILGILGGAFADQYDRRRLMVFCDLVRGLGVLLIAVLLMTNHLSIFLLTIIGALVTSTYAVSKPASKAFVPSIVRHEELTLANGLIQSVLWPSFFLGAGLVGVFSAINIETAHAFITCAIIFFGSLAALVNVKGKAAEGTANKSVSSIFFQLRVGLEELQAHRALMVRISSYFFYTISWRGMIQIALPLYVINHLDQPATFYSSLMVACGVGELISSLILGRLRVSRDLKLAYLGEIVLAFALMILVLNFMDGTLALGLSIVACVLIGFSATIIDIPLVTAIQTQIDDDKSGKIFSYWSALGALGGSVGTLVVSGLVDFVGLDSAIVLMLVWLVLSAVVAYYIAYARKDEAVKVVD